MKSLKQRRRRIALSNYVRHKNEHLILPTPGQARTLARLNDRLRAIQIMSDQFLISLNDQLQMVRESGTLSANDLEFDAYTAYWRKDQLLLTQQALKPHRQDESGKFIGGYPRSLDDYQVDPLDHAEHRLRQPLKHFPHCRLFHDATDHYRPLNWRSLCPTTHIDLHVTVAVQNWNYHLECYELNHINGVCRQLEDNLREWDQLEKNISQSWWQNQGLVVNRRAKIELNIQMPEQHRLYSEESDNYLFDYTAAIVYLHPILRPSCAQQGSHFDIDDPCALYLALAEQLHGMGNNELTFCLAEGQNTLLGDLLVQYRIRWPLRDDRPQAVRKGSGQSKFPTN